MYKYMLNMLQAHEHIYCMLYMCIFPHVSNKMK